ncbi:olfactory receptor 52J3-like [Alosa alosa]|uniref:olfactory receptor 52J3-like n=1 Tax=Alosa sapidissima TaxID=34773 RepID=UPI001C09FC67|nr:olfactory receptor 52J3-like [Alosa sapidissima]XP_048121225.1 olfactory receptor 52J3-like [Alosa alosa]
MFLNSSSSTTIFLPSFTFPPSTRVPALVFSTLTYLMIMCCNLMIVVTIALNHNLHKPMYLLLLNLPVCDMIGATAFFPQMISSMLYQPRVISYWACVVQALLTHTYGGGSLLILTAMAFDRYIAICSPLSYNTIMTNNNLIKIISGIWLTDTILIFTLIALAIRLKICQNTISDMYCNNPSLTKLACEGTHVNNFYGLFTIAFLQGISLAVILFTYLQILFTCVFKKQADARSKAIQTCGAHLIVFLFLEFNAFIALVAHRIETAPLFLRRALGVSVMIFPPLLNPLVYSFNTKEIRKHILQFLKRKTSPF